MEERVMAPVAGSRPRVGGISPRVALLVTGAVVVGLALYAGRSALGPFIVGLLLAYLLDIPVERIARLGAPRWIAVLVVYAIAAVVVVQGLRVMLRPLADEIATFITEFPRFSAQITDQYAHLDLPEPLRRAIDMFLSELGSGIGSIDPAALLPVASVFAGIVGTIVAYIIVPVWAFYLIKDRHALRAAAERSMPEPWRADAHAVTNLALRVFRQWLRGQLVLGVAVGLSTFVGLLVLGATIDPVFSRFAIFLSVIAGLFELLPIIGPILSAIPAVLLALTAGVEPALAALLLYLVIQQVENNLFVPKIQGDAVELHPTIVMVALVVGGAIGGLLGAILALPITAAARDVFRYTFHRVDQPPMTPEAALASIVARPMLVDPSADDAGDGSPSEPVHAPSATPAAPARPDPPPAAPPPVAET
jgi:predicted PurR-regulated permease PerM